jgi:hypothetical protein
MAVNKPKNLTIHEILTRVSTRQTKEERIEVLKQHNCLALRDILKGGFDDTIEFILPEGVPPYEPSPEENPPSTLHKVSKNFRYFAVGGPGERLPKARVEQMLIRMLEVIHPKDAELVIAVKDKQLAGRYRGLSKKLVQETFPTLIAK